MQELVLELRKVIPGYIKERPVIHDLCKRLNNQQTLFISEKTGMHLMMDYERLFKLIPENELNYTKNFIKEYEGSIFVSYECESLPLLTFAYERKEFETNGE